MLEHPRGSLYFRMARQTIFHERPTVLRLLLLLAISMSTWAQVQVISDTLTSAVGGGAFAGRITVTLNSPGSAQPLYFGTTSLTGWQNTYCISVTGSDCSILSTAGSFVASLYANSTILPSGTSYSARFQPTVGSAWTETWVVEVGNSKILQIRRTTVPSPSVLFNPSQIRQAGATSGQCLAWNGTAWAPAACGSGSGGNTWDDLLSTTWDDLT